jgi:type I restriction enzyme S subunit
VDNTFHNANCIDLIIIRKSRLIDSDYLCFVLNSAFAKSQFAAGSDGAIQQHFNIETASNLIIPLPPLEEQRTMVDYLKGEVRRLTSLATKNREQIEKLREYRQTLISAAVTGKIAV